MDCTPITECLACGSTDLVPLLDLNTQPLANSYKKTAEEVQQEFPLAVNRCTHCYHVQLTHQVNPELMFKDYAYVSGTSKTQLDYFHWFVNEFSPKFTVNLVEHNGFYSVLDIGCNDGSLLDVWAHRGYRTYGVDPAENLHKLSSKNHKVHCGFFTGEEFDQKFDVITCFNAFAHNPNPLELLKNMAKVMDQDGYIFVSTSQSDMIKNGEFDTIYHEHTNFFNIRSMRRLCDRAGLQLQYVQNHPIHGNSYIFVIAKRFGNDDLDVLPEMICDRLEKREEYLYEEGIYKEFTEKAYKAAADFSFLLRFMRNGGYPIIGYGAPAKGNVLMNFAKARPDLILEDNPLKQGLFTPGMSVPILAPNAMDYFDKEPRVFVPMAWNFFDEIKGKIKEKRPETKDLFLRIFPNMEFFT
jgi:2-polyprenyl-3-methyl-5-hydroxy-6-metoxy-1,4-benzoquinol methylase